MEIKNYICPKCQNRSYEVDEFAATGGGLSKMFDVQNKRFTTITCTKCKYTEMYKGTTWIVNTKLNNFFKGILTIFNWG
ncbi:zinc ribbon domain-containing protein [Turicibacter sanguinis]|uniref:zinc ribbon domain-containing protein n=1 Tax=Turicibacter sanguinis TaxID=154288 RepID=UPI001E567810|nr:zinc ribbon domain-containing protein [Turicibacter sanguinis]